LKVKEEGNTVDAIVEVQVMSEKKYSSEKKGVAPQSTTHWNEHLFFEPKNCVR